VASADVGRIGELLGLGQEAVRALERRGLLHRLDLDEAELRERLWRGHLAYVRSRRSAMIYRLSRSLSS
jgi:hypothetical protein